MPEAEQEILGVDLSYQESVAAMNKDPSFMMIPVFTLEQGGSAAAAYAPVTLEEGEYLGFVSITFVPSSLIRPIAEDVSASSGFDTMAAQTDSLVLYDADATEIDQMTLAIHSMRTFLTCLPLQRPITSPLQVSSGTVSIHQVSVRSSPRKRCGTLLPLVEWTGA